MAFRVLVAWFASVALATVANAQGSSGVKPSIAGTWMAENPSLTLMTADGALPPLKAEARLIYDERVAARAAGDTSFDRATWCASPGMPRIMFMPYPMEIVVDERRVAVLSGWYRRYRLIDMSGADLEVILLTSMGVSMGRWRGDRLTVETVGLLAETTLDGAGLPHSEAMKLTERFSLKDPNTLEIRFTVNDPEYYVRPWDAAMTYRRLPGEHVVDDVCVDRLKAGEPAVRSH
jgi:hypothetical protein